MTHLLDSSAVLAFYLDEPGANRVDQLLSSPGVSIAISALTLYEISAAVKHRTGSVQSSKEAVAELRQSITIVKEVTESIVDLGIELRRNATDHIALADCLIAATALNYGLVLVHRDPHFSIRLC